MLKISDIGEIEDRLVNDGDLRQDHHCEPREYEEGDALGFYQQATEYLFQILMKKMNFKEVRESFMPLERLIMASDISASIKIELLAKLWTIVGVVAGDM